MANIASTFMELGEWQLKCRRVTVKSFGDVEAFLLFALALDRIARAFCSVSPALRAPP